MKIHYKLPSGDIKCGADTESAPHTDNYSNVTCKKCKIISRRLRKVMIDKLFIDSYIIGNLNEKYDEDGNTISVENTSDDNFNLTMQLKLIDGKIVECLNNIIIRIYEIHDFLQTYDMYAPWDKIKTYYYDSYDKRKNII